MASRLRLILKTGRLPPWATAREPGEPRCWRCLYDLKGVEGERCPECGAAWERAWYAGRWPAGCRARATLAAGAVVQSAVMVVVSLGQIVTGLFALDTLRRMAPGMDDVWGWFALLFGAAALSLAVSAACVVLAWRRYGWVRFGPMRGARLGLALMATPLIVLVVLVVAYTLMPMPEVP